MSNPDEEQTTQPTAEDPQPESNFEPEVFYADGDWWMNKRYQYQSTAQPPSADQKLRELYNFLLNYGGVYCSGDAMYDTRERIFWNRVRGVGR
jgi:hypothetical protein